MSRAKKNTKRGKAKEGALSFTICYLSSFSIGIEESRATRRIIQVGEGGRSSGWQISGTKQSHFFKWFLMSLPPVSS